MLCDTSADAEPLELDDAVADTAVVAEILELDDTSVVGDRLVLWDTSVVGERLELNDLLDVRLVVCDALVVTLADGELVIA